MTTRHISVSYLTEHDCSTPQCRGCRRLHQDWVSSSRLHVGLQM